MTNRRYMRLTNGFSEELEKSPRRRYTGLLRVQLQQIHRTRRCTPALAAGATVRLWGALDLVALRKRLGAGVGERRDRLGSQNVGQ